MKRSLTLPTLLLLLLASAPAWASPAAEGPTPPEPALGEPLAQYFDDGGGSGTPAGRGYFDGAAPRQDPGIPFWDDGSYRTPLILGMGGGLGLGWTRADRVDDRFFLPNETQTLGTALPFTFEGMLYAEFQERVRVGLLGQSMLGGSPGRAFNQAFGGLMVEAGGGMDWRVWGGITLGGMRTIVETLDDEGRRYRWDSNGIGYRLHMRLERQFSAVASVHLTPWVQLGSPLRENFEVPAPRNAPANVIPRESGWRPVAAGISLGLSLSTGR
jgi:hypothetical protein